MSKQIYVKKDFDIIDLKLVTVALKNKKVPASNSNAEEPERIHRAINYEEDQTRLSCLLQHTDGFSGPVFKNDDDIVVNAIKLDEDAFGTRSWSNNKDETRYICSEIAPGPSTSRHDTETYNQNEQYHSMSEDRREDYEDYESQDDSVRMLQTMLCDNEDYYSASSERK